MINLQQFPIHKIEIGDDVHDPDGYKLLRKVEVTLDLTRWEAQIRSIQEVAQGIYNDDALFYLSDTEIGLEHHHEPCIRNDGVRTASVQLTCDFISDLKNLARIVRSDFDDWIEEELKSMKDEWGENSDTYIEESLNLRSSRTAKHQKLGWIDEY
jgi:hypothetical protein